MSPTYRISETTTWIYEAEDDQQAEAIAKNFKSGVSGLGMKHAGWEVSSPVFAHELRPTPIELTNRDYNLRIRAQFDEGSPNSAHSWYIDVLRLLVDVNSQEEPFFFSILDDKPALSIELTSSEAEELTFGRAEEDGGFFSAERDFVLSLEEFEEIYESIPERVSDLLQDLEDYRPEQGTYQPDS